MTYQEFLKTRFADRLNDGQLSFFREFLSSNRNIFLTGGAGTGKSFVLSRFSEFCESEGIFLNKCASTGVAAININSQTLHSFLGVGIAEGSVEVVVAKVKKNKLARKRLENCRLLFIDEISMISGEFLDKFYAIIKAYCRKMPRVVMSGDFLQLPPVFKEDRFFAFESDAWEKLDPKVVNLIEIVRQCEDKKYSEILQRIRVGDKSDIPFLNSLKIVEKDIPNGSTVCYSKNVEVDNFNLAKLQSLPGGSREYISDDVGSEPFLSSLQKNCLAPSSLLLKPGAQVMLLKNINSTLSNGSIGTVKKLLNNSVIVSFDNVDEELSKESWKVEENLIDDSGKVKTKILASRSQIPLKLAWAITAHKIQGLTCDKISVDISSCFAPGQAYVALSRARSLNDLKILGLNTDSIRTCNRCLSFYNSISHFPV